ncbi:NfeD family protein [Chloroflexota bacterium]
MEFTDEWLWLIFVGIGLLLVLLELIIGVETGLDLVFIGTAFILGGLVTWPFNSWIVTLIVTTVICVAYIFALRHFIKRRLTISKVKTNIDTIVGKKGIVLRKIDANTDGRVKVGNEEWKARAEEDIGEGDIIIVKSLSGVTLIVEKDKGGK